MKVEYADKELEAIESESAAQKTRLPIAVIKAFRAKLIVLRDAPDERTLRNWKSLHYEKLKGNPKNRRSIRLNKQWRLVFTIDSKQNPVTIRILGIEDYH